MKRYTPQPVPADASQSTLPSGWAWAKVEDILIERTCNGISVKGSDEPPGIPALRLSAMTEAGFDYQKCRYIPISAGVADGLAVRAGDIYVSRGNGSLHLLGRATLAQVPPHQIVFPDTMIRLRFPAVGSFRKYVQFLWSDRSVRRQIESKARTTAGIYKISQRDVEQFVLPIPPLNEQRRIVVKLEELFSDLDAGVAALKRAKVKLTRYRAAVLKAAVEGRLTAEWRKQHPATEPASKLLDRILAERRKRWEAEQEAKFAAAEKVPPKNWRDNYAEPTLPDTTGLPQLPDAWCWARLDQLIVYLRNGYFQKPTDDPSGMRLLRINSVRPMRVDLNEVRYLKDVPGDVSGYCVEDGDLLFTRYNGSIELLGVVGIVRGCTEPTLHPDKLIRVKAAPVAPLNEYLALACNVGLSRRHMEGRARTTAGQTGISGTDIRDMPIPLPPQDEQHQILALVAERLSHIVAAEKQIEADLRRSARLRQSILKRAFDGRLVPQDPKDEPASVLLERIKAQRPTTGHNGQASNTPRRGRKGDR